MLAAEPIAAAANLVSSSKVFKRSNIRHPPSSSCHSWYVQGWAKEWSLGCVNPAS